MGNYFGGISRQEMDDYRETVQGKFDDREIAHMHKLFHQAAPKGEMGQQEFKRYIESLQIFKRVDQQETYEQLFRGYDRDGDKSITFKEYLQYHLGIVFSTEELFDIIFAMYDVDGDEFITKDEMTAVITNSTRWMGHCDVESRDVRDAIEATVDQIIKVADRDGDKKLSKVELRAASQKHPEILEKLKNLA
uniref:EF-hand domain-containing protein n=1 Tax=Neobodo designis TaxID=312471 RepID=A0A7S1M6N2_NEODS|mmetsp:Transcript_3512/g.10905  ORF Transcript_3512/g.10905 Transcript_3512/m.10905 type:complete len:192 (+) Transcript_3512:107-682(+)|eukprot:CAMPEP_0174856400 /NCGR_PEP_ID=MMETSP1114-20130205/35839_1 /TAXON_ID=312471 /ORGANISM="Neobodo designis, Strain CCAP 1951/1" /LENGTH=191 /DNA_ID=CAMNT_0016091195 /DNA_START=107 /DNA_END=682 /DNA_ORIENTATION=+